MPPYFVFAVISSLHSYLILAYAGRGLRHPCCGAAPMGCRVKSPRRGSGARC